MSECVLQAADKMAVKDKCKVCTKSGLPVLLTRPSVVALDAELAPPNQQNLKSPTDVLDGLVPAKAQSLKKSRYVLRSLRAGYLYVYYEKAQKPDNRNWDIYRVTGDGDLIRRDHALFYTQGEVQCSRNEHNANALKVLHIPNPHEQSNVWLAFSANLWDDKLIASNKANTKVMQKIDVAALLGDTLPKNSFKATEDALATKIAEHALSKLDAANNLSTKGKSFPFSCQQATTAALVKQMQSMANAHPKTKDKALVIVLRDPAAVATELNELRLLRHDQGEKWLHNDLNMYPVQVNQVIQSLRRSISDDKYQQAMERIRPIMTQGNFIDLKPRYKTLNWDNPRWAKFEDCLDASHPEEGKLLEDLRYRSVYGSGFVVTDNEDERARKWASESTDRIWQGYEKFYDEAAREQWNDKLYKDMEVKHLNPLKLFEADWNAWLCSDELVKDYFDLHFDADAINDPKADAQRGCSSGLVYCQEVHNTFTPANYTDEPEKTFHAQLDADIKDKSAVLQRALFANQKTIIEQFQASIVQLVNDPGNEADGKRDKFYDFMKGLITVDVQDAQGRALHIPKLSWLSTAMLGLSGNVFLTLAGVGMQMVASQSWARTIGQRGAARAHSAAQAVLEPRQIARLRRVQALALANQNINQGLSAITHRRAPAMPMIVWAQLSPQDVINILHGRGQMPSQKRMRWMRNKASLRVAILTDSQQIESLGPNAAEAAKNRAAQIHVTFHPSGKETKAIAQGSALIVGADAYYDFMQRHLLKQQHAARNWTALKNAAGDLDGRLAVGSMLVQGIGLWIAASKYQAAVTAGNDSVAIDALYGIWDGVFGLMGGAFELWAAVLKNSVIVHTGAQAGSLAAGQAAAEATAHWGMAALRAAGAAAGAAGNIVNALASWRLSAQLDARGEKELAKMAKLSGDMFLTGSFAFGFIAAHWMATSLVLRGIGARMASTVMQRTAVVVGFRLLGVAVVPFVGWVVTAVGVGLTIVVSINTPNDLEKWLKDGVFGKNGTKRFNNWAEAEADLKKLMGGTNLPP